MRYIYSFAFFLFLAYANAQIPPAPDLTQYKTTGKKLQAWALYCDEYLFVEDYQGLRKTARKGLRMTPAKETGYQSLFNFYIGITFNYGTETDSAAHYLERSEKFARLAKNNKRTEQALLQLLHVYSTYGNSIKRQRVLIELEARADTIKDNSRKGEINGEISTYYTDKGEYEKGLHFRLESLKSRRSFLRQGDHNDSINFGVTLINVAELYIELKNPEKTLDYLKESQGYIKDYQDGIATIYKDFTTTLLQQNKPAEAKVYYHKLLDFLNKGAETTSWGIFLESDLAFADYYLERNERLALAYTNHAVKFSKYADSFQRARINHLNGKIYLRLKQYGKALGYFKKAEPIMADDSPEKQSSLQKSLAATYAALGNWKLAHHHLTIYSGLQDHLLNEKAKSNLAKMEAQYQNKKKQGEINILSAENKIKNLEIENAGKQRIFFIIGLVLLFIIIGSLIVIYRNKQKSSMILEQKNQQMKLLNDNLEKANTTKAKLFSIIGHDLRSPISHIYQFLDLQQSEPELFSEADKKQHNERISGAASALLETMEDLLIWSKSQMQQFTVVNETIDLAVCIDGIISLMQPQIDKKKIAVAVAIPNGLTLVSDPNILTILIRNILQNALKFSPEKSTVSISAKRKENRILLSISDEGSGVPLAFRHVFGHDPVTIDSGLSGLGLTLVKEMAELLHARITIDDREPHGSVFNISIDC